MGGCASRPKDLKSEAELPVDNTVVVEEVKQVEAEPVVEVKAETRESTGNKEEPLVDLSKPEAEEPKLEEAAAAKPKVEQEAVVAPKVSEEAKQEEPKEEAPSTGSNEVARTTPAPSEEKIAAVESAVVTADKAEEKKEEVAAPLN